MKLIEVPGKGEYTTRNLLGFLYLQNYYKIIGIDLSRQTNTNIFQPINFTGKLEQDDGALIIFNSKTFLKIH